MAAVINSTDAVSVVVPAGLDGFWMVPPQYLSGNILGVYGSRLKLSLYYAVQDQSQVAIAKEASVVIQVIIFV